MMTRIRLYTSVVFFGGGFGATSCLLYTEEEIEKLKKRSVCGGIRSLNALKFINIKKRRRRRREGGILPCKKERRVSCKLEIRTQ